MLQAGKMKEVADEMLKHKFDIVAVQEIRWQGQGRIDKKDFTLIYSGPNDKTGQLGTGFLINKTARDSILDYQTLNDRICKIRLKGKFRNVSIVSAHAPTEEKPDEDKEIFYETLDEVLSQLQRYDLILVISTQKSGKRKVNPVWLVRSHYMTLTTAMAIIWLNSLPETNSSSGAQHSSTREYT